MSPIPRNLAVEDALSEAVLRQMLKRCAKCMPLAPSTAGADMVT